MSKYQKSDAEIKLQTDRLQSSLRSLGQDSIVDYKTVYFVPHDPKVLGALMESFPCRSLEEDQNLRTHNLVFIVVGSFEWNESKHTCKPLRRLLL